MKTGFTLALAFGLLAVGWLVSPESSPAAMAEAAPELDALFQRKAGWTGADGDFSVALSTNRTLWLFGDSWVGNVKDGKRTNTTLVNNTVAIQRGKERPEFFYGTNATTGRPAAFFTPADGRGYFWPFHGVRTAEGLYLFFGQVENVPGQVGAFNFKLVDGWLGRVANPDDSPTAWKLEQRRLPFAEFTPLGDLLMGVSILRDGRYLYIYGLDSRRKDEKAKSREGLVVARVEEKRFGDFEAWRFFKDGRWQADSKKLTPLCKDFPTEFSITRLPGSGRYAAVYMGGTISGKIQLRMAPTPTGPWGEPRLIYECPEQDWPEKVFCYSAKAHPELAEKGDELVITYAANSFELRYVVNDARLYWPRFVKFKVEE